MSHPRNKVINYMVLQINQLLNISQLNSEFGNYLFGETMLPIYQSAQQLMGFGFNQGINYGVLK